MAMNISASNTGTAGASEAWSGASAPMAPSRKMSNLFDQIDANSSGSISQSQFMQAFQSMNPSASFQKAGADAVWNKLDPNGTGQVSKQDFTNDMVEMMKELRGTHDQQASLAGAQALAQQTLGLDALGSSPNALVNSPSGTGSVGSILNTLA